MARSLRDIMADKFRKGDYGHPTLTGWDFRTDEPLIRSRAIRAKCVECQAGQDVEVRRCEMYDCPLWPYRSGRKIASESP